MGTNKNKYGLSRNIPAEIKFAIRKKSGFGCVVCGCGIITYEHFEPEFKDCTEHNPEGMTLLCPTCQQKKTGGKLSKETVIRAVKNPKCLQLGYSKDNIDIGEEAPTIIFAGSMIYNCPDIIVVEDKSVFRIIPPTYPNDIFKISAIFYDGQGNPTLMINENEWIAYSDVWDIETSGNRIIIRNSNNEYSLILNFIGNWCLEIEKIRARYGKVLIEGDKNKLTIRTNNGVYNMIGCISDFNNVGIAISSPNTGGAGFSC